MSTRSLQAALVTLAVGACGPATVVGPTPPQATSRPRPHQPAASAPAAARPARIPSMGPNGEMASLQGRRVKIVLAGGGLRFLEAEQLHAPPGDRALAGISPTALLFLDDGTLLTGAGDGTVTGIDGDGNRLYSIGFRGAISGLALAGEGLVALTTELGVMAVLTADGRRRWERQITAEQLTPPAVSADGTIVAASQRGVFALSTGGEPIFTHASALLHHPCWYWEQDCHKKQLLEVSIRGDEVAVGPDLRFRMSDPHPAVPGLAPVFPLTYRKVLDESAVSLLPDGATGILALVTKRKTRSEYEWDTDDNYDVVQLDGGKTTRLAVPHVASKSEIFIEGTRATKAALFIDRLVNGPDGLPWVLARRIHFERTQTGDSLLGRWGGAGQILEVKGGAVRERHELFKSFSEHWLSTPIGAPATGTANLLCFGYESPTCAAFKGTSFHLVTPPGRVTAVQRIGDRLWLLTDDGKVFRNEGTSIESFEAVPRPEKAPIRAVGGASEKEVWGDHQKRYLILRWDGSAWTEVPVPLAGGSFFARAADDVWSGRARWDGQRWSLVYGAPPAAAMVLKGRDDVWVGNEAGLWHGTAPGPSPVTLPPSPPVDDMAPEPTPVTPAPPDAGHAVQKMSIEVAGGQPLTAARNVSASPDGVLWLQTWDRLVEVDNPGRATSARGIKLRDGRRDFFGRWAVPEAKGRGTILGSDKRHDVIRADGAGVVREEVQLDQHDAVAVHRDPRGATWVVGAPPLAPPGWSFGATTAWEELSAHALVRAGKDGFRPVLGLPSAAWCDVAATPDGGAWFAGGLNAGPSGEGILFHARGALGAERTARYRAPASLLAVTATGPDEAWAVGAAGTVVHVKGGAVTRFALASGAWLRAVHAAGPGEVWIGGDGGTLLHHDGRTFHSVAHPLGTHAAFTGITSAQGTIWAVGPSGILRVSKRP